MEIAQSFCALCLLLVMGKFLRSHISLLRKLYLPSSVVGGLVGLLILTFFSDSIPPAFTAGWSKLPGFLICVVFGALFLGMQIPDLRGMWRMTASQVCFGQVCAWGQYVVGIGLTVFLLTPLFGVHSLFGNLLEIGFEGGHGTVGGLTETFTALKWEEGKDLGLTVATGGMLVGVIGGMALINWALRRGILKNVRRIEDADRLEQLGFYSPETERPHAGTQTVYSDSIDSLAYHIAILGMAIFVGIGLKELCLLADPILPARMQELKIMQGFPLFVFCMIGSVLVQVFLVKMRLNVFLDHGQIQRIAGASLDFLVVSAIASIRLDFVAQYWLPLLILIAGGAVWNFFCVLVLAPRFFKKDWFERGIAEFGQMSGVTATGLLLLRTADPENKSCGLTAFGSKQLFHEPIMGGGFWTTMALPCVLLYGGVTMFWVSLGALLLCLLLWYFFFQEKPEPEST
ncbi:MAG: hypothetical protein J6J31_14155 [Thermoguttaceae bacterium]|nr:hypothetical protein [Thermoguttaceae bacterium]